MANQAETLGIAGLATVCVVRGPTAPVSVRVVQLGDVRQSGWKGVAGHSSGTVTVTVTVAGKGTSAVPVFRAGLLDNDVAVGDPAWGARIPQYRLATLAVVDEMIAKLETAIRNNVTASELTQECQRGIAEAQRHNVARGVDDWPGEIAAYRDRMTRQWYQTVSNALNKLPAGESQVSTLAGLSSLLHQTRAELTGVR